MAILLQKAPFLWTLHTTESVSSNENITAFHFRNRQVFSNFVLIDLSFLFCNFAEEIGFVIEIALYIYQVKLEWTFFTTNLLQFSLLFVSVMAMMFCNICVMLMCHSIFYVGTNGFIEMLICNIRLWQLKKTIKNYYRHNYPSILYVMIAYRKTILYAIEVNSLYGEAFLVFVVINFPTSAILVMNIIMGLGHRLFRLGIVFTASSQAMHMFIMHCIIAHQNTEMNSYSKQILTSTFSRQFRIRTKIHLNLFIQTFYTRKMYGITYGKFGLISLLKFLKVSNSILIQI